GRTSARARGARKRATRRSGGTGGGGWRLPWRAMMPSPHVRVQARSNAARYGPRDMNFFGHACVAARVDSDPRVLLGAMLPDFASMSRTRLAGSEDPAVAAGIALH